MFEQLANECVHILESCGKEEDSARLDRLLKAAWAWTMADRPEYATETGCPLHQDRWTDWSLDALSRRKQAAHRLREVLVTIDRARLSDNDQLSYDILLRNQDLDIAAQRFPMELLPISQMHGVQQEAAQILALMPARTNAQREAAFARLERLPLWIEQVISLLEAGMKLGVTQPRITMTEVPQQILNQIPENPLEAPVLGFLSGLPESLSAAEHNSLVAWGRDIYEARVAPAFSDLHRFMVDRYLPACRDSVSWRDLPDGADWYRFFVEYNTTTEMTPDEIFELGMSEVARIRREMERVISESGFSGGFDEFCEFLRTDDRFFCRTPEELLRLYRDISKRVDPELARFFRRLPQTPYGVTPIPSYAEKSQTTAYYQPGSLVAGRAGYFFANTYNLKARPKWEMEALTLHEAVPGHHLHISLMQEMTDLPDFRRQGWITAYGEGWALYAESLGDEMGFYRDPYSKFGQLTYEMWRAIRLVVDPGIHWKGWSRRQAIDFFKANSSKTEHDIAVEIDRYIVWPGQALSYKIGELRIKALRNLAEKVLGEKFDIRAFHDEVLGYGCLPLTTLESRIKSWITAQS